MHLNTMESLKETILSILAFSDLSFLFLSYSLFFKEIEHNKNTAVFYWLAGMLFSLIIPPLLVLI